MINHFCLHGLGRASLATMFAIIATSCNPQPTAVVTVATVAVSSTAAASPTIKPGPTSVALGSPLAVVPVATGASQTLTVSTAVAPIPGRGQVIGRAVQPEGRVGHPSFIVSGELYLGTLAPASDPKLPPAVAVSPLDAPHARVDQKTGVFVFSNVTPGTYALVMIGFSESFVFERPNGGGRIDVTVEANKTTELGDVTLR